MTRNYVLVIPVAALICLCGCSVAVPGTTRTLGQVEYASAFATAHEVVKQYFPVASADPATGIIQSRPKPVHAQGERLLGSSPARKVATVRISRKNGRVVAHASVALQREGSAVYRTRTDPGENYDEVPNRTPADEIAASTPEQNEVWQTEKYDHATERKMLDDLYNALHPEVE